MLYWQAVDCIDEFLEDELVDQREAHLINVCTYIYIPIYLHVWGSLPSLDPFKLLNTCAPNRERFSQLGFSFLLFLRLMVCVSGPVVFLAHAPPPLFFGSGPLLMLDGSLHWGLNCPISPHRLGCSVYSTLVSHQDFLLFLDFC